MKAARPIMRMLLLYLITSTCSCLVHVENATLWSLLRTRFSSHSTFVHPADGSCEVDHSLLQKLMISTAASEASGSFNSEEQAYDRFQGIRDRLAASLQKEVARLAQNNCTRAVLATAVSFNKMPHQTTRDPASSKTGIVLVSSSWERVMSYVSNYSLNVMTVWSYARSMGYGLELYVHHSPLPPQMTGHFVKIPGVLSMFKHGYDYVLGMDWDMYIEPSSAVPLSTFFDEWPAASVLIQGESNLCTAALLYRNTRAATKWLNHWWNMGISGCCRVHTFDQIAFKHMLHEYMKNFTGNTSLYSTQTWSLMQLLSSGQMPEAWQKLQDRPGKGPGSEPHFLLEPPQTDVQTWLELKHILQTTGAEFGFAGLDAHSSSSSSRGRGNNGSSSSSIWIDSRAKAHQDVRSATRRSVALHSCHGIWWGCVPKDSPALLMHTSHRRTPDTDGYHWLAGRMLRAFDDWARQPTVEQEASPGSVAELFLRQQHLRSCQTSDSQLLNHPAAEAAAAAADTAVAMPSS